MIDAVLPNGGKALALTALKQPHTADVIIAYLEPHSVLHLQAAPANEPGMMGMDAVDLAIVLLLELIAVVRIIEKEGEVREQIERVIDEISMEMGCRLLTAAPPFAREA